MENKPDSIKSITYTIPGISCHHCVHTIKSELSELEGVTSVEAWVDKKQAVISYTHPANEEKIKALLTEINYPPA